MYQLGKLYSLINEKSREDEEKVGLLLNFSRCVGTYSSAKFEYMRLFCANVIKLSIKTLGFEDNKKSCSALCRVLYIIVRKVSIHACYVHPVV